MEIDESVFAFCQTLDLVSQLALTPFLYVINLTLTFQGAVDTVGNALARLFVSRRCYEIQQFISLHQLTSFGLMASGLKGIA